MKKIKNFSISGYFKFSERKTTFKKEIIGGIVTFLAMAYILAVQPSMMKTAKLPVGGVFLATVISSFVATMIMGLLANVPISLAPGMGINAFFVYTVCIILKLDPYVAISTVLVSGWLYFIVAITPARHYISKALSKNIKISIGAGLGFFLAFLGLQQAGIIQSDAFINKYNAPEWASSATAVSIGDFKNPLVILGIVLIILAFVLHTIKIKGSIIITMIIGVIILGIMYAAGANGVANIKGENDPFVIKPFKSQFNELGQIAGKGWTNLGKMFMEPKAYIAIFVFLYSDFFDTTGTIFAIDEQVGITKKEGTKWIAKANIADATGTLFGASVGASTVTSYVESTAGAAAGAKTGFSACVTGILFLLSLLLWPIMGVFMPIENVNAFHGRGHASPETLMPITSPALVLVGSLMVMQLKEFDWKEAIDVPVMFMTILSMILTYNISTGIATGVVLFVILNFFAGLKQRYNTWRGHPPFVVDDEQEMLLSSVDKKVRIAKTKDYWARLNIPILAMFVLGMAYFGTMPLYMY